MGSSVNHLSAQGSKDGGDATVTITRVTRWWSVNSGLTYCVRTFFVANYVTAVLFAVLLKERVMCIVLPECEAFNGLGIQR